VGGGWGRVTIARSSELRRLFPIRKGRNQKRRRGKRGGKRNIFLEKGSLRKKKAGGLKSFQKGKCSIAEKSLLGGRGRSGCTFYEEKWRRERGGKEGEKNNSD